MKYNADRLHLDDAQVEWSRKAQTTSSRIWVSIRARSKLSEDCTHVVSVAIPPESSNIESKTFVVQVHGYTQHKDPRSAHQIIVKHFTQDKTDFYVHSSVMTSSFISERMLFWVLYIFSENNRFFDVLFFLWWLGWYNRRIMELSLLPICLVSYFDDILHAISEKRVLPAQINFYVHIKTKNMI